MGYFPNENATVDEASAENPFNADGYKGVDPFFQTPGRPLAAGPEDEEDEGEGSGSPVTPPPVG